MPEFIYDYALTKDRLEIIRTAQIRKYIIYWTTDTFLFQKFVSELPLDSDTALEEYLHKWYKRLKLHCKK